MNIKRCFAKNYENKPFTCIYGLLVTLIHQSVLRQGGDLSALKKI